MSRKPQTPVAMGPDGVQRPLDIERRINECASIAFSTPAVEQLLLALEAVTTRRVLAPPFSQEELIHLEGARWLFGVLKQRIHMGRNGLPSRKEMTDE